MKSTIHCYITGRVQGVFFRVRTREQAMLYGITGWVRNLVDGRVEVMASGEEEQLRQLQVWLQRGPEYAQVIKVDTEELEYQEFSDFGIRSTS